MLTDVAIIGGTGVGDAIAQMGGEQVHLPTREGQLSGKLIPHSSGPVLLVSRHSVGHKVPPHRINYKSIALGLQKAGVTHCFSTAAVGSLRPDWAAGTLVAVSDFLDLSGRSQTVFDDIVVHTDFTNPISVKGREALIESGRALGIAIETKGVYVCENGPRYETPVEIALLTRVGDLVGMTAATEAILLHEVGISYACLAVVTNLATGLNQAPLSHEEVVQEVRLASDRLIPTLLRATDLVRGRQ